MLLTFVLQTRLIQVRIQNKWLHSIQVVFTNSMKNRIIRYILDEFLEKLWSVLALKIAVRWKENHALILILVKM